MPFYIDGGERNNGQERPYVDEKVDYLEVGALPSLSIKEIIPMVKKIYTILTVSIFHVFEQ